MIRGQRAGVGDLTSNLVRGKIKAPPTTVLRFDVLRRMTRSLYRNLVAWQKGMDLVRLVYELTDSFPSHESRVLQPQMRRAAISVPSNLAEGQGRWTRADARHFLLMSRGSLFELETQISIAEEQGYIAAPSAQEALDLAAEIGRLINGLVRRYSLGK